GDGQVDGPRPLRRVQFEGCPPDDLALVLEGEDVPVAGADDLVRHVLDGRPCGLIADGLPRPLELLGVIVLLGGGRGGQQQAGDKRAGAVAGSGTPPAPPPSPSAEPRPAPASPAAAW